MTAWFDRLTPRTRSLLSMAVMVWAALATLATSAPEEVARSAITTVEVNLDSTGAERRLHIQSSSDGHELRLLLDSSPPQTLSLVSPLPSDPDPSYPAAVTPREGSLEIRCMPLDCSEVVVAVMPLGVTAPLTVEITVEAVAIGSNGNPPGIIELVVTHE